MSAQAARVVLHSPSPSPSPSSVAVRRLGFGDVLVFAVPALLILQIHTVGQLYVSELMLVAALPFLLHQAHIAGRRRIPQVPLLLGTIWLVAQIWTDIYRGSAFIDYSRGWANIAFLLANFAALYLLIGNDPRRMRLFAWGIVVGLLAEFYLRPTPYAISDPWKFGVALPLTLGVVLLATTRRVYSLPFVPPALIAFIAVVNLQQGYRSLAGICAVASGFAFFSAFGHRRAHRIGVPSVAKTIALCACCALAAFGFTKLYARAANDGLLGRAAQTKYESQAGALGVIVGGRPEILASLDAIKDSPLIGHGSWAKDPKYAALMIAELERYGYQVIPYAYGDLIPEHSHLLGAWVDAGVFGTFLWFWALGLGVAVLSRLYLLRNRMTPLAAFVGLLFVWDILFSPFGAERRLLVPFYLIVLLFTRDRLRGVVRRSRGMPVTGREREPIPEEDPEWAS